MKERMPVLTLNLALLAMRALRGVTVQRSLPLAGTVILTDACNLHCRHCGVSNIRRRMAEYPEVRRVMERYREQGIGVLFFAGGEPTLWRGEGRGLDDLCREAKEMGFALAIVVTNGTVTLNLPHPDLVFLSIDGTPPTHDAIRGETFAAIMANLDAAPPGLNVCLFAAINNLNYREVEALAALAYEHPRIRSISYNLHTPHPGTEGLALAPDQRREAVAAIIRAIDAGYPVMNLRPALEEQLAGGHHEPCRQHIVWEEGRWFTCGRCSESPRLCDQWGYLFASEMAWIVRGGPAALLAAARTYARSLG
ncbi:MAG TPA: radical SAM protein [Armatimonadota bacterium]|jgi:MoaA/NifB/PqqE/SkfB family radical SAM enzyme